MQIERKKIMKHSSIQGLLLTALFVIIGFSIFGQNLEPKKRPLEPDATISSKITGKDYQLYISFPGGYSIKDTTRYPVLYVLDGAFCYPIINMARRSMDMGKELEDVIIVCIGSGLDLPSWYSNRFYDDTPSSDTFYDRQNEKEMGFPTGTIRSGGAANFLRCITTEIIPYIDTHCKTTNDRGIAGHSLGGLFATYCMLNSKGIFTRYGLLSPSLWWNNNEIVNQAESLFSKNKTWDILPTKVFISVGKKEDSLMFRGITKFSKLIEDKDFKNVSFYRQFFDDETHQSVLPAALSRTLSVLYGIRQ
jgi:predicted alpha/beta superfamily hydrolase